MAWYNVGPFKKKESAFDRTCRKLNETYESHSTAINFFVGIAGAYASGYGYEKGRQRAYAEAQKN